MQESIFGDEDGTEMSSSIRGNPKGLSFNAKSSNSVYSYNGLQRSSNQLAPEQNGSSLMMPTGESRRQDSSNFDSMQERVNSIKTSGIELSTSMDTMRMAHY